MNIFFSHSTVDADIVQKFVNILGTDGMEAFYSSNPETGITGGERIMSKINQAISECDLFIPVITENYIRSMYCMYELSVVAFLRETSKMPLIIPIAASRELYERVSSILRQFDLLYIDALEEKAPQIFCQTFEWVGKGKLEDIRAALDALAGHKTLPRPYIGMPPQTYTGILEYCEAYGITQIKNTTMPSETLKAKVSQAKEVILLSTTGASLIKSLCTGAFPAALANGCKISVLVPNQHSQYCVDVSEIERPDAAEQNLDRLDHEFSSVMVYLKESWEEACKRSGQAPSGSITCYCAHTLLRQTILLVKNQDDTVWGWVSLTMPPKRTIDGTPSLAVEGRLEPGQMVYLLWNHCNEIMALSRRRKSWFLVDGQRTGPFFLEKNHAKAYWQTKYAQAQEHMKAHEELYEKVLIEVAAQHPLKMKKKPGKEFAGRLDLAMEIGAKYEENGIEVMYYVPGSRHRYNGVDDLISLSKAGCDYLKANGVPPEQIIGEEANIRYKGADGVYNSADECYVASRLFLEGEYDRLICVCSPNQVFRKTLFYIEFGVLPQCYSAPADKMFHSMLDEIFEVIEGVLYKDHGWQDPQSETFVNSRAERMPRNGEPV